MECEQGGGTERREGLEKQSGEREAGCSFAVAWNLEIVGEGGYLRAQSAEQILALVGQTPAGEARLGSLSDCGQEMFDRFDQAVASFRALKLFSGLNLDGPRKVQLRRQFAQRGLSNVWVV